MESNFSNFEFEYLCKKEFLSKAILACLSGAQLGLIYKKIEVKNLVTLPLLNTDLADQTRNENCREIFVTLLIVNEFLLHF